MVCRSAGGGLTRRHESPIYQALLLPWHLCCAALLLLLPPGSHQKKKKRKRKTQPRLFPSLDVFKLRVLTRKLSDERTTRSSPSERCLHAPSFLASLVLMLPTRRPPPPPPFPTAHAPLLPPARSLTSQAQSRCDYVTGQLRAASLFCLCVYLFFLFLLLQRSSKCRYIQIY